MLLLTALLFEEMGVPTVTRIPKMYLWIVRSSGAKGDSHSNVLAYVRCVVLYCLHVLKPRKRTVLYRGKAPPGDNFESRDSVGETPGNRNSPW